MVRKVLVVVVVLCLALMGACAASKTSSTEPTHLGATIAALGGDAGAIASPYVSSWLGNSFGGINTNPDACSQNLTGAFALTPMMINAIAVSADGMIYTNGTTDEGVQQQVSAFHPDGGFAGTDNGPSPTSVCRGSFQYGNTGVAVNSTYLYTIESGTGTPVGSGHYVLARKARSTLEPVPWGPDAGPNDICAGFGSLGEWYVAIDAAADVPSTSLVTTSAVANDQVLVVSLHALNQIRIFDAQTMTQLASFTVSYPGQVAIDQGGSIWVVEGSTDGGPSTIASYQGCSSSACGDAGCAPSACADAGTPLNVQITDVANPQGIATDPSSGHLLVVDYGQVPPLPGLNMEGTSLPESQLSPMTLPLPHNPDGGFSDAQQILVYDLSTTPPTRVRSIGQSVGVTNGGVIPSTLINPSSIGADSNGNIYVSSWLPTSIKAFAADGTPLWTDQSASPNTTGAFDPSTDGGDIYAKYEHFQLDYSKSNGQEATWVGHTIAPAASDDDPRAYFPLDQKTTEPLAVRVIGGHRFLFVVWSFPQSDVAVYRLDGETAVPIGYVAMKNNWTPPLVPPGTTVADGGVFGPLPWIWNDTSGDGIAQSGEIEVLSSTTLWNTVSRWDVDSNGNLWVAWGGSDDNSHAGVSGGVFEFKFGTDPAGNLVYHFGAPQVGDPQWFREFPMPGGPTGFSMLTGIKYAAATDTAYLTGLASSTDGGAPYVLHGNGPATGSYLARYDAFTTGSPQQIWAQIIDLPNISPSQDSVSAFDVAGSRVFVGHWAGPTIGQQDAQPFQEIEVRDTFDGKSLGWLSPGENLGWSPSCFAGGGYDNGGSPLGAMDDAYGVRAFQRGNGEYVVLQEDDGSARTLMYRGDMNFVNVSSFYPGASSAAGGYTLTIKGTDLFDATVTIGSGSCTNVTKIDDSTITCITPPYSPATGTAVPVPLVVTTHHGNSSPYPFYYLPSTNLWSDVQTKASWATSPYPHLVDLTGQGNGWGPTSAIFGRNAPTQLGSWLSGLPATHFDATQESIWGTSSGPTLPMTVFLVMDNAVWPPPSSLHYTQVIMGNSDHSGHWFEWYFGNGSASTAQTLNVFTELGTTNDYGSGFDNFGASTPHIVEIVVDGPSSQILVDGKTITTPTPFSATNPALSDLLLGDYGGVNGTTFNVGQAVVYEKDCESDGTGATVRGILAATWGLPPAVNTVSPGASSAAGGYALTIQGADLFGAISVTIGTGSCTSLTQVSDTVITCVAPAYSSSAGTSTSVPLVVNTNHGSSSSYPFYYLPSANLWSDARTDASWATSPYPHLVDLTGQGNGWATTTPIIGRNAPTKLANWLNGLPATHFDQSEVSIWGTSTGPTVPLTLFLVMDDVSWPPSSPTYTQMIMGNSNYSGHWFEWYFGNGTSATAQTLNVFTQQGTTNGPGNSGPDSFGSGPHIVEIVVDGASSQILVDGVSIKTFNAANPTLSDLLLGDYHGTNPATFDVGQAIIYEKDCESDGTGATVRGILSATWGL